METTYNNLIQAEITKLVYGHETELLDTGFGFSLCLVDRHGEQTGHFCLIGGSWKDARHEDGSIRKRYLRYCPCWTVNLHDVWELLQYCKQHHPQKFDHIMQRLQKDIPLDKPEKDVALYISETILSEYTQEN